MNIKELLLEGCVIAMSYKENPKEWVGETKIHIFEGGCGCEPKIIVEGGCGCEPKIIVEGGYHSKDFKLDQIDEAIKYFSDNAFTKKNLWYKMNEVTRNNPNLDFDEEEDLKTAMKARELIIKKTE